MQHPGKGFYEAWQDVQHANPERDAILRWKAANLANLYLRTLKAKPLNTICEIGGAEGIVLAALGSMLHAERLINYEISSTACTSGLTLFPHIDFRSREFDGREDQNFDVILLSDIVEHVEDDNAFLETLRPRCKYLLVKVPIEESVLNSNFLYRLRGKHRPFEHIYGPGHMNGHLRGYTIKRAKKVISRSYNILDQSITDVTYFYGSSKEKAMKRLVGARMSVPFMGGALFLLAEPR